MDSTYGKESPEKWQPTVALGRRRGRVSGESAAEQMIRAGAQGSGEQDSVKQGWWGGSSSSEFVGELVGAVMRELEITTAWGQRGSGEWGRSERGEGCLSARGHGLNQCVVNEESNAQSIGRNGDEVWGRRSRGGWKRRTVLWGRLVSEREEWGVGSTRRCLRGCEFK